MPIQPLARVACVYLVKRGCLEPATSGSSDQAEPIPSPVS